jgi:uncharacterized membrane protein YedE/YeeE
MRELIAVLLGAYLVTLTIGTVITLLAFRAAKRRQSGALTTLALGFALFTGGAVVGIYLTVLGGPPSTVGRTVAGLCNAAGFVAIAYSLFVADWSNSGVETQVPND